MTSIVGKEKSQLFMLPNVQYSKSLAIAIFLTETKNSEYFMTHTGYNRTHLSPRHKSWPTNGKISILPTWITKLIIFFLLLHETDKTHIKSPYPANSIFRNVADIRPQHFSTAVPFARKNSYFQLDSARFVFYSCPIKLKWSSERSRNANAWAELS